MRPLAATSTGKRGRRDMRQNPKTEIRNSKKSRNPKSAPDMREPRFSDFYLRPAFGFRTAGCGRLNSLTLP